MLATALCCATATLAQSLPAGTALPVVVSATLDAGKDKPGQKIEGKLMQDVRLPDGPVVKKGARVAGQVLAVHKPTEMTVQFSQLEEEHRNIPLNVSVRALAAANSVFQAQLPADASTSEQSDEWVTRQVGGDYVFRGRGYVSSDQGKVAIWDDRGVWGKLSSAVDCPDVASTTEQQALWIFSTAACGAYGFEDLKIAHDGSESPAGQITLESGKKLLVRGGSGWLLVVNATKSGGVRP